MIGTTGFIQSGLIEITGMMGQSNVAGIDQGADPANEPTGQKTLVMSSWATNATGSWEAMEYEVNNSIPTRTGTNIFGPEMAYMHLQDKPHYLVKCAEYGSGVNTSAPSHLSWNKANNGKCYQMARLYINQAFSNSNGKGVMRKFFWYQGHADCNNSSNASAYEVNLTALLLDLESLINSLNPSGVEVEMILIKSPHAWVDNLTRTEVNFSSMELGKANTALALNNGTYETPPEYSLYDTAHITSANSDALGILMSTL